MPRKFKIFLDSSALIAGLNSPTGSAGMIISAFIAGEFFVYISEQVIEEVQRSIETKFPLLKDGFSNFLLAQPKIVKQPSLNEVKAAHQIIDSPDAPILAAAIKVKLDFVLTWDIKHFLKKDVLQNVDFIICTPADFLQKHWRKTQ